MQEMRKKHFSELATLGQRYETLVEQHRQMSEVWQEATVAMQVYQDTPS